MKKTLIWGILCLTGLSLLVLQSRTSDTDSTSDRQMAIIPQIEPVTVSTPQQRKLPATTSAQQEQVSQVRQRLEALISQYDQQLSDPHKRAQIKQEMDLMLKKYNELVLPNALVAVKQSQ